jgi:hypothetical protein
LKIRIEYTKLDNDILTAQTEAYEKRSEAEEQLKTLIQRKKDEAEKKKREDEKMIYEDDIDELDYVDTLMINEEGDIDDNNNNTNQFDFISNSKLSIDGLISQVESYLNTKLVKCMPSLSEYCFIHNESQQRISKFCI